MVILDTITHIVQDALKVPEGGGGAMEVNGTQMGDKEIRFAAMDQHFPEIDPPDI